MGSSAPSSHLTHTKAIISRKRAHTTRARRLSLHSRARTALSRRKSECEADRTEAPRVVGTFQVPLEPAIARMDQGDGPFDASELNGEHQSGARARAMAGEALLETVVAAEPHVVARVIIGRVKVNDVDHASLRVLTRSQNGRVNTRSGSSQSNCGEYRAEEPPRPSGLRLRRESAGRCAAPARKRAVISRKPGHGLAALG